MVTTINLGDLRIARRRGAGVLVAAQSGVTEDGDLGGRFHTLVSNSTNAQI